MTSEHSGRRRTYALLGIALLLAGIAGGAWFARERTPRLQIDITFLSRDGQEIGKRGPQAGSEAAHGQGYFLDWAASEVQRLMQGKDEKTLVAWMTLDIGLQEKAEQATETALAKSGSESNVNQAALVSLDIPDGAVRAMVGGRDYSKSRLNYAAESSARPALHFSHTSI